MNKLMIRSATIIGSEHQRKQLNNQDGYITGQMFLNETQVSWGVICDGCSAGKHSGVGSKLLSRFLGEQIKTFFGLGLSVSEMPNHLFVSALVHLKSFISSMFVDSEKERAELVKNYFLCTIMGFISDSEKLVFFHAGDGMFIVDDQVTSIDQNNKPFYLSYHLVDKDCLSAKDLNLPFKFDQYEYEIRTLNRFAISSDGLAEETVAKIWDNEHPLALQRKLRVMRLKKQADFYDDCTVITAEKVTSTGGVYE